MIFARSKTVAELRERVEALEKAKKELELEWALAYEKLRSLMGRIAKRAQLAEVSEDPVSEKAPPSTVPANGRTPGQIRAESLRHALLRR